MACAWFANTASHAQTTLLFEDFETEDKTPPLDTGWTNDVANPVDWIAFCGITPTSETGPFFDHTTGSGDGLYIYIESSEISPGIPSAGDFVVLRSPIIDATGVNNPVVSFWYHMFDDLEMSMGTLRLDVLEEGVTTHVGVWSQSGNQGNPWQFSEPIPLGPVLTGGGTGNIQLIFHATLGGPPVWRNDMALDDVLVREPPDIDVGVVAITSPVTGVDLGLETVTVTIENFGDLPQSDIPVQYTIDGGSPVIETFPGPIAAGTRADFTFSTQADLSFLGAYVFEAETDLAGDLTASNNSVQRIVQNISNLALFSDDFETQDVGSPALENGWTNDVGNTVDWLANQGPTDSDATGPSVDNTSNSALGTYLHIESSSPAVVDDVIILDSPLIDVSGRAPQLRFFVHMFGASMGTLAVDVIEEGVGTITDVWTLSGDQGDLWQKVVVDIASVLTGGGTGNIQVRFRGTLGGPDAFRNDMAIDDVSVVDVSADIAASVDNGADGVVPGEPVTYIISATNLGPGTILGASVNATFPPIFTDCTWTCALTGPGTCTAGPVNGAIVDTIDLAATVEADYTVTCNVDPDATGNVAITATATSSATDPFPGNDTATDDDPLTPMVDLQVTKDDNRFNVIAGSAVEYRVTVTNPGPSFAENVSVVDDLPALVENVTWTCEPFGGAICPDTNGTGDLDALVDLPELGASVLFTFQGTISAAAPLGVLSNTATATPPDGTGEIDSGDNSATDDTNIAPVDIFEDGFESGDTTAWSSTVN
ncbi:MAG: hypothetical protein AAGD38_13005 [Acidobacteriota bacterium]